MIGAVEEGVTLIQDIDRATWGHGCETQATPMTSAGPARSAFLWADIFNGQDARWPHSQDACYDRGSQGSTLLIEKAFQRLKVIS